MSARHDPHDGHAASITDLAFCLLTVSDTRSASDDVSGGVLRQLVGASGHRVHRSAIVPDDPQAVRDQAVAALFDVRIDGFGELFRLLSFEEIGSRAMLSRAVAGVVRGTPVFLLPGSPAAVTLALTRLVLPEIAHVVGELRR